jgi:hypothetical protein
MDSNSGSISSSSESGDGSAAKNAVRYFQGLKLAVPYFVALAKHISFHCLSTYYARTR